MKKLITVLILILSSNFCKSQCSPDPQYTSPGYHPNSHNPLEWGPELPSVCANYPFNATFTIVVPTTVPSTTWNIIETEAEIILPQTLPNSIVFTQSCNPPSCIFPPGSIGCIEISTPDINYGEGWYDNYFQIWNIPPIPIEIDYDIKYIDNNGTQSQMNIIDHINDIQVVTFGAPCNSTSSLINHANKNTKELLKVTDLLGRETPYKKRTPLFYIYDDGTVEKRIVIE